MLILFSTGLKADLYSKKYILEIKDGMASSSGSGDRHKLFTDILSGYKFCMKHGNPDADYILRTGIPEHNIIEWSRQFLTKGGTFVDIGAHIGSYSIILSSSCKQVHAFEAQLNTFGYLKEGIEANGIANINTYNVGLGSKKSVMTLKHVSDAGGGSSFLHNLTEMTKQRIIDEEKVEIFPLDDYNLDNIDFIKIDVEGFELKVIKGAEKTLERNNYPPILYEAWPDDWYKERREKLNLYVESLGYNVHKISGADNMYLAGDHPKYVKGSESIQRDVIQKEYDTRAIEISELGREMTEDSPDVDRDYLQSLVKLQEANKALLVAVSGDSNKDQIMMANADMEIAMAKKNKCGLLRKIYHRDNDK